MNLIIQMINHFPKLRGTIKSIYYHLQGLPPITYSKITKELIFEAVGKANPTILEIGCNDGGHTLWLDQLFENPTIYCFEPDPRAIERFKKNIGYRSNIHLFEIALSDINSETTFYQSSGKRNEIDAQKMPKGWDLSGSIKKPKNHLKFIPWVSFNHEITVKTKTLDKWCEENMISEIDFIWMDVQGAEMEVLRGGKNTIAKTRYLYTEYSNKELYEGQANLRKLLKAVNNFDVLIRYPGDVLLRNNQID